MKGISLGLSTCGGGICILRHNFVMNAIIAFLFLCFPVSIAIKAFPETLNFFDGRQIIFLLPVLGGFLEWGMNAGCHLCLFSHIDQIELND
ncbi:MAG: hypothetical protein PHP25_04760 [Candidatus Moranbacteria bacterium]|nr:hypothetical protein [Candidatus Moranbacteria bacterium]